jgi:mono/diheme cytochrome c family protein
MKRLTPLLLAAAFLATPGLKASADEARIERGKYLVGVAGCGDCHTPGYFLGKPDMSRQLSGSDVGFEIPQLGSFYGPNLTPDKQTGLGAWSEAEIVTAFTTGVRPDGRDLAPVMPWRNYTSLKPDDASAIAAYLKTLPPITNKVPGPFGPNEKASSFVMRIIPPGP